VQTDKQRTTKPVLG